MNRVKDKAAVVTGSASGIGEATAKLLAAEGAKVAVLDIKDKEGKTVAAGIKKAGGTADFWHADVSKEDEVKQAMAEIYKKYGKLDILVNNAGIPGGRAPAFDLPVEEWDRVMNTNLKGAFLCVKYASPYMIKSGGGSIVNVASCYGIIGCDTPVYDTSKGGMRAMSKSDAIQLARFGIRVNSVHPGNIETPLFRKLTAKIGGGLKFTREILGLMCPLDRMGKPEEIAYGILFLASDEASYVTASELVMDGGMIGAPPPVYPDVTYPGKKRKWVN
ncbi:MAG: glucose 1-dehydrogenase [Dehalococcoidales bacterium]|jgi:NAD(P)-dependent dehydrogenase (short-subunit alcohol dehydrogenase family)